MVNPETLAQFTRNAAQQFIQTAVYIDDKFFSDDNESDLSEKVGQVKRPPKIPGEKPSNITKIEHFFDNQNLNSSKIEMTSKNFITSNVKDIIKGFADKQIICSLYQPQPKKDEKELEKEDLVSICSSADIIILDWKLKNMEKIGGTTTKNIIGRIVKQAINSVPEQLRLIVVYTIDTDLQEIIKKIYLSLISDLKLKKKDRMNMKEIQKNLSFQIHNCKISLFKKPFGHEERIHKGFVVGYDQLAERALDEFTKLVPGILEATALQGLATIRNNYKKIISKFGEDMDRGFLTHLGMSLPDGDALSELAPILMSEIESVLVDASPNPIIPEEVFSSWIDNKWKPKSFITKPMQRKKDEIIKIGKDVLKIGFKEAGKKNSVKLQPEKMFMENITAKNNNNFARLLSSRTFYDTPPKLSLGTIVFDVSNNQFLLCIQPVCDSVRLKEFRNAVKFLFLKLHRRDNKKISKAHTVFTLQDYNVELNYKSKSSDCVSIGFRSGNKETIIARKDRQKKFYFKSSVGNKYVWVDQLRTAHAQRAAEIFGREISRVGLVESEWLRLKAEGKIK